MSGRDAMQVLRTFGRHSVLVAALLVALAAELPAVAAASSSNSLGVVISEESSGRKVLSLRAGSIDSGPAGEYSMTARLLRIPCPGRYRFRAEGENQLSGSSSSYTAILTLSRYSSVPAGVPCGRDIPSRPGRGTLTLSTSSSEPLYLSGRRGGGGNFSGLLLLRGLPECGQPYTLLADLDLKGWRRSFSFRLEVSDVTVTREGVPAPALSC